MKGKGWLLGITFSCALFIVTNAFAEERQHQERENKEALATGLYQTIQKEPTDMKARRKLAHILVESEVEAGENDSEIMAVLETRWIEPSFPALSFPLTFLNNGALTSKDASMNQPVLLVLQKLQNNDNNTAIKLAEHLQQKYPQHPVPYNLLGLAWQGKGDPNRANDFFEKALALKEDFHTARLNLAELKLHLGDFQSAHQEIDRVLQADNYNRRASLVKADLYILEGQKELANHWYSKANESL